MSTWRWMVLRRFILAQPVGQGRLSYRFNHSAALFDLGIHWFKVFADVRIHLVENCQFLECEARLNLPLDLSSDQFERLTGLKRFQSCKKNSLLRSLPYFFNLPLFSRTTHLIIMDPKRFDYFSYFFILRWNGLHLWNFGLISITWSKWLI